MTSLTFVASSATRIFLRAPTGSLSTCVAAPDRALRVPRRPRVSMQQSPFSDEAEALGAKKTPNDAAGIKTAAQIKEDEIPQTWQGNAWFAVIMVGMVIAVGATLARDFIPGGGPAVML
jgi:hypothetical protein